MQEHWSDYWKLSEEQQAQVFFPSLGTGWYHLYYNCECGEVWEDEWDCACNDRCPACNKEIEPYKVEEVE